MNGGQHDTKDVTFELLMHAAFVADEIWGFMPEPARMIYYVQYVFVEYLKQYREHSTAQHNTTAWHSTAAVQPLHKTSNQVTCRSECRVASNIRMKMHM